MFRNRDSWCQCVRGSIVDSHWQWVRPRVAGRVGLFHHQGSSGLQSSSFCLWSYINRKRREKKLTFVTFKIHFSVFFLWKTVLFKVYSAQQLMTYIRFFYHFMVLVWGGEICGERSPSCRDANYPGERVCHDQTRGCRQRWCQGGGRGGRCFGEDKNPGTRKIYAAVREQWT